MKHRIVAPFAAVLASAGILGCSSEVETKVVDKPVNSPYATEPLVPRIDAPAVDSVEIAQAPALISGTPHWTALEDWKQVPAPRMVDERYELPSGALLSISSLGGGGSDAANLARWARQLGLTFTPEMTSTARRPLPPQALPMSRYALANSQRGFDIAILRSADRAWFFKLEGTPDALAQSENAFLRFLIDIHTHAEGESHGDAPVYTQTAQAPAAPPPAEPAATNNNNAMQPMPGMVEQVASIDGAEWRVPNTWETGPANPMRKGTYLISNSGGDAELSITAFPGDVGGLVANVNRWRRQSGLPPLGDQAVRDSVETFQIPAGDVTVVMIEGESSSILGAILPQGDQTWFFKMTGPAEALKAEAATFNAFLETVQF